VQNQLYINQDDTNPKEQEPDHTSSSGESGSESESNSSGEEDGSDALLVQLTPMSEKLGYVDVFGMKTKLDHIHTWLKGLEDDSPDDDITIQKSTVRHHRRAVNTMRHCLRDAAPMAIK